MTKCCVIPSVNGVPASAVAASGLWEVVYEMDFSAEPTVTLSNGQNVLSDGTSWTVENDTAATTFRILNGAGIQFAANGTSSAWNSAGGGFNASVIWISLNDQSLVSARRLIPDWDLNRQYLFQVYNTVNNGNAATEVLFLNLYSPGGTPYASAAARVAGSCKGGNSTVASGVGITTQVSTPVLIGDYGADDVVGFSIAPGMPSAIAGHSGLFAAGDWPDMANLRECGWCATTATPAALTAARFTDPAMRIAIAHPTGNSTGTFSSTTAMFRVLGRT